MLEKHNQFQRFLMILPTGPRVVCLRSGDSSDLGQRIPIRFALFRFQSFSLERSPLVQPVKDVVKLRRWSELWESALRSWNVPNLGGVVATTAFHALQSYSIPTLDRALPRGTLQPYNISGLALQERFWRASRPWVSVVKATCASRRKSSKSMRCHNQKDELSRERLLGLEGHRGPVLVGFIARGNVEAQADCVSVLVGFTAGTTLSLLESSKRVAFAMRFGS